MNEDLAEVRDGDGQAPENGLSKGPEARRCLQVGGQEGAEEGLVAGSEGREGGLGDQAGGGGGRGK